MTVVNLLILLVCLLGSPQLARAQTLPPSTDWFTVAGNYNRTSTVSEDVPGTLTPDWFLPIGSYVSQRIHPIATKDSQGRDTIYVAASDGLYAVDPSAVRFDTPSRQATSGLKWHYPTSLPSGNSPTVVAGVAYLPGMDKRIHAIKDNGNSYQLLWRSPEAEAGFQSNPIVINNTVYAANRDGSVYAFDLNTGSLKWRQQTGGTIYQSPAYDAGVLYVASNDMHAYAISADTGAIIWKSDADPSTPQKDKFPGPMFQSYWPVVYSYNGTKYVIFVRLFDITQTHLESTDLYSQGSTCDRNSFTSFLPIVPIEAGNQPWMHGFSMLSAAKHITYLDNQNETYILSENTTTCDPATRVTESANRAYRRTYFMVYAANGNEYLADLEGNGQVDDHMPFAYVGGKAGTAYPPLIGSDNVLYARNNYITNSAIGRGGLVGWVPGSRYFSLPEGNWAIDEPSAYAAGPNFIHHKLMAERAARVFRYSSSPTQSSNYWDQGGDSFLSYLVPELFRRGWPYGYWKSGDQAPMIPFRGKVYSITNNALVEFSSQGTAKQYLWNQTAAIASIRNKNTGVQVTATEGPLKITGIFSNVTSNTNIWPTWHQQESYLDLRPNAALNSYPMYVFNPFSVIAHPSLMPTQTTVTASTFAPTLTSTYDNGTLTIRTSPVTPTLLLHNTGSYLKLSGPVAGIAYPSASGITRVIGAGDVAGSSLTDGWFIVWDTSDNHRWFPVVVSLENRPSSISVRSTGIILNFASSTGHISLTPFNGLSSPLPGKGPTYYADDRLNSILDRWQVAGPNTAEVSKADQIDQLARVFPTSWTENSSFTTASATQTYSYSAFTKFGFAGGSTPSDVAFIPPTTALAAWNNTQITFNSQPLANHLDLNYPLPLGRWAAVANTGQLSVTIPGVSSLWTQSPASSTAASASDPLVSRLSREISAMETAGHLRPYRIYYGILNNLDNSAGEWLFQYYHNPSETILTLLDALPLLPSDQQLALRTYIQSEYSHDPITSIVHTGFGSGTRREDHLPLPDFEYEFNRANRVINQNTSVNWSIDTQGWSYSPKSLYTLAKYAQEFGNAQTLFSAVSNKLQNPFTGNRFRISTPYTLNNYLAGYLGYIKLGNQAAANTDTQKQVFTKLLLMRLALSKNPESLSQTGFENGGHLWTVQAYRPDVGEITFHTQQIGTQWSQYSTYGLIYDLLYFRSGALTGGAYTFTVDFLDLVPEVGSFMSQHALPEVTNQVTAYERMAPYWFMVNAPEAAGEVSVQPWQDRTGLLNAKRYVLNATRSQLEPYVDVPALKTGDLFYIQGLTKTISAPGTSLITPVPTLQPTISVPTSTQSPTQTPSAIPTPIPGDANSDLKIDGLDYIIWLNHYEQAVAGGASVGDFNNDGKVDGADYVTWLNHYQP
ncbi:hypothetical protein A2397_02095 [Candidatus Amesbacteria bacterium RIFOXYB1_FULL_44_23]|uniref:Pyrrolo-quinoline quinone repeat domain-containing protein n=1 Tax=Candidatus Amesbacteria bacterium RIFOXYB1_FULL_44_23 TaxID=1797263 RepID=A0A1F4ZUC3_9BACT|nr:MAG: hypothetical protein A2397_02095 [Candidatus Amesbacteria bacterium RIFOXYB1_FULL_44_23]